MPASDRPLRAGGRLERVLRAGLFAVTAGYIEQVRQIPGVAGVHLMAYRQEEMVAEIIRRAGLFPRVTPDALRPAQPQHA